MKSNLYCTLLCLVTIPGGCSTAVVETEVDRCKQHSTLIDVTSLLGDGGMTDGCTVAAENADGKIDPHLLEAVAGARRAIAMVWMKDDRRPAPLPEDAQQRKQVIDAMERQGRALIQCAARQVAEAGGFVCDPSGWFPSAMFYAVVDESILREVAARSDVNFLEAEPPPSQAGLTVLGTPMGRDNARPTVTESTISTPRSSLLFRVLK